MLSKLRIPALKISAGKCCSLCHTATLNTNIENPLFHKPIHYINRQLHSSSPYFEGVHFKLADIGEGIHEVELLQWFVKEGDRIKQFDKICEVQSDKATVEITSRYDGVVTQVHHELGHNVKVGDTLVEIDVDESSESKPHIASADTSPKLDIPAAETMKVSTSDIGLAPPKPEVQPPTTWKPRSLDGPPKLNGYSKLDGKVLATPAVRRIAREQGIPLSSIQGSGKAGRILKEDILTVGKVQVPRPGEQTQQQQPILMGKPVLHPNFQPTPGTTAPLTPIMKAMSRLMDQSLKIPHMLYADQVEMDRLIQLRSQLKPQAEEMGLKLTFMPFIIKATSLALKKYPILNSSINEDDNQIIYHADHNLGIAMDTPQGLVVPVIKYCQQKSILDIAQDLNELRILGTEGKLLPEHFNGATFSLSNIGIIGGTYTAPIISPPQVAIGALGKTIKVPKFDDSDNVIPCQVATISWSADHRVVDGASIARFSNMWKEYLENPSKMIFDLR